MRRLTTATLIVLLVLGSQAAAQDDRTTMMREEMQQTFERLELTDEQIERVEPILQESARARRDIMAKYGMDPRSRHNAESKPAPSQMKAMRNEMEAVRKKTFAELEQILSAEQLEEFNLIREERRAEMRERMREAR